MRYAVVFEEQPPVSGGGTDLYTEQKFDLWPVYNWPADIVAPTPGPYVLPASCHLGFKFQGGATVDNTLGITGSQTGDAIAAVLNALPGFNTVGIADATGVALRIKSLDTTSASSVQVDGAVTNSA